MTPKNTQGHTKARAHTLTDTHTHIHTHTQEMTYTQFWALVSEGNIERVRYFGPEQRAVMVKTRQSAPGGARFCKVRACVCV